MRYLLFIVLFSSFFGCLYLTTFAQNEIGQDIGTPLLHLFSPKTYNGHPQIWAIEQDNNGVMYFSGRNVYSYDGVSWRTIVVPNTGIIRALGKDAYGRIYVGIKDEFGYLAPSDSTSEMEYVSLTTNLNDSIKNFGEVWTIAGNETHVYFHTLKQIFIYDIKNKTFKNIPAEKTALRGFLHQGNYYFLNDKEMGFVNPTTPKIQSLANTDTLKNAVIVGIVSYTPTELLFFTQTGQIWKYDLSNQNMSYFPTEIDIFTHNNPPTVVYHAITLKNGNILISTIFKGAFLIDKKGNLLKKIDKSIGLPTQIIPYVFEDQNKNIWLATDNGIAKLELQTPLRLFEEKVMGYEGVVLSMAEFNENFYIGTTKGIFHKNSENSFTKIEGLNGFCWDIKSIEVNNEKHLYAITQDNLFYITPQKALPITEFNSINVFEQLAPNKIILAGRGGFRVLKFDTPTQVSNIQTGTIKSSLIRTLVVLEKDIWFGTGTEGLYKIPYTTDSLLTTEIYNIDSLPNIPKNTELNVFDYNNELLIGTPKGIYSLNKVTQQIESHPILGKNLTENQSIFRIAHSPNEELYIIGATTQDKVKVIDFDKDGNKKLNLIPFLRIPSMSIQSIYYDSKNTVWIGGSEGLYRYYPQKAKKYDYNKIPKPLIRNVFLGEDSLFFAGNYIDEAGNFLATQPIEAQPVFTYDNNSITFHFAAPIFQEGVQYSYKLEGYDKNFSNWTNETKKSYTNLHEGKYTFQVKTKNIYTAESEITTYSFKILPPWFRTWWAYLLYVVVVALVVWGLIWINTQRLKKANQRLENTVKERTAELMERNEEIVQQNSQLNQQKEEIEAQSENQRKLNAQLSIQKTEIEKAYKNVQLLSEIGQEITAILNFEDLIQSVYQNVNALMPADGFGIGIFDESNYRIGFQGFIEKGQKLPYHFDALQENTFAVRCFNNLEEIIINDLETEGAKYEYQIAQEQQGEIPLALVYLPLQLENKPLGVITVQSFNKNAYSERELTFLRSLASYVSIALDNASAYQLITEKNQKITDSIRYAQTIQHAILPSEKKIEKPFRLSNDDYQIIFRPKDIVSGDFYWTSQTLDYFFVAAVDCTGHGVPGAFMSMIGSALLTEIVEIQKIHEPSLILDKFNEQFVEALRQDENANSDGMDVCLCRINFDNQKTEIVFAGAKRPLFYVNYNENTINTIERLQGTRKSVGGKQRNKDNFEQHILLLNKKSRIYLTTDGLIDQNNPKGEKFGTTRLAHLLESTLTSSIKQQISTLENELTTHQQNAEQRDDITFIGIEV